MSAATLDAVEQNVLQVTVHVDACGILSCQPSLLTVTGSEVLITFVLNGKGWVFPDAQAVVVNDGGDQFPIPAWTINPKQAALLDCNSASGNFSYTVTVQDPVSGEQQRLDPAIRNEI
jgi:hypothetical protein